MNMVHIVHPITNSTTDEVAFVDTNRKNYDMTGIAAQKTKTP